MSAASLLCCLTGSGPSARRPDARGASADAQATRHVQCRDIIVHPQFVQTLSFPPVEFCPMDWLPDEVITNVLVHVVRGLATTRRASVRATRRDRAGVGRPSRILAPKALTPARVFSTSVPLADRRLRVLSFLPADWRRRGAFRRRQSSRAASGVGRLAVARAFRAPVQVRGPAGRLASRVRGRVAGRVPAPPDDAGSNRAGRSARRARRVFFVWIRKRRRGTRRGGARVPRRLVTRQLVSMLRVNVRCM